MTRKPPSTDIMTLVESQRSQISAALPTGIDLDRVIRMTRTALATNETLAKCQPRTVLGAVIECAQLGLEPGITGHLVPYYDSRSKGYRAQLIPDYRGLMALARRSGEIAAIFADVVCERDTFEFSRGTRAHLEHVPMLRDRGEVVASYAVAEFKSGSFQFEVVTREELDTLRDSVLAKVKDSARKYSPWVAHEAEMQKKTAVRRLCKFLPFTTEDVSLQRAIVLDEAADRGEQRMHAVLDVAPALEAPTVPEPMGEEERGALAEEVQNTVKNQGDKV